MLNPLIPKHINFFVQELECTWERTERILSKEYICSEHLNITYEYYELCLGGRKCSGEKNKLWWT